MRWGVVVAGLLAGSGCSLYNDHPAATQDGGIADAPAGDAAIDAPVPPDAGNVCPVLDPRTPGDTPGQRLHPVHWTSTDGLDVVGRFYDRVLANECRLGLFQDGSECVGERAPYPHSPEPPPSAAPDDIGALDLPFCNEQVYIGGPGLAHTFLGGGELRWLGDEIAPKPVVYCAGTFSGKVPPAGYHVYLIEREESDAVTGAVAKAARSERRGLTAVNDAVFWEYDDGAEVFTDLLVDRVHRPSCAPLAVGAQFGKWLPPLAIPDACGHVETVDIATIAPDGIQPSVARMGPSSCVITSTDQPPYTLYDVTPIADVPLAEFDDAPPLVIGGSRLTVSVVGDVTFPIVPPFGITLHDATLDTDCRPELADDGVVRCLPPDVRYLAFPPPTVAWVWYADAACTQPIAVITNGNGPVPPFARVPQGMFDSCSGTVFSVGAQVAEPAGGVYGRPATDSTNQYFSCTGCQQMIQPGDPGYRYFAASELPADTFAAISEVIQ